MAIGMGPLGPFGTPIGSTSTRQFGEFVQRSRPLDVTFPTSLGGEDVARRFATTSFDAALAGRRGLQQQTLDQLGNAPAALQTLRQAIPAFGGAAGAAANVLGGGPADDFAAALQEASAFRGEELGGLPGNLNLFTEQFLPDALRLGVRTTFGQLPAAGIIPTPSVDTSALGALQLRGAELEQQFQANLAQSRFSLDLFNALLPSLV